MLWVRNVKDEIGSLLSEVLTWDIFNSGLNSDWFLVHLYSWLFWGLTLKIRDRITLTVYVLSP